jgi:hypothetical protein
MVLILGPLRLGILQDLYGLSVADIIFIGSSQDEQE